MVVYLNLVLYTEEKTLGQNTRCMEEYRVIGMFPCQAYLSRPKPTGPLGIITRRIEVFH